MNEKGERIRNNGKWGLANDEKNQGRERRWLGVTSRNICYTKYSLGPRWTGHSAN